MPAIALEALESTLGEASSFVAEDASKNCTTTGLFDKERQSLGGAELIHVLGMVRQLACYGVFEEVKALVVWRIGLLEGQGRAGWRPEEFRLTCPFCDEYHGLVAVCVVGVHILLCLTSLRGICYYSGSLCSGCVGGGIAAHAELASLDSS